MRPVVSRLKIWPDFIASSITAVLGLLMIFVVLFFDIDVFEGVMAWLSHIHVENHEIDEFFIPIMLMLLGGTLDLYRYRMRESRRSMLNADRLRTMRSTMSTVEDIINNLLNNYEYLRFVAVQSNSLDDEAMALLDGQIRSATEKLNKVREMDVFIDRDLGQGIRSINLDEHHK